MIFNKIDLFGERFSSVHKDVVPSVYPTDPALEFKPGRFQEIVVNLDAFFRGFCFKRRAFFLESWGSSLFSSFASHGLPTLHDRWMV